MTDDELEKLLDFFCELDEDGKLRLTKADFYRSISTDEGRKELKATAKSLGMKVSLLNNNLVDM